MYRLLDERGPDHSKVFHISVVVAGRVFPAAWGANKKEAEQTAAQHALEELLGENAGEDRTPAPPELRESDVWEVSAEPAAEVAAIDIASSAIEAEPFGLGVEES